MVEVDEVGLVGFGECREKAIDLPAMAQRKARRKSATRLTTFWITSSNFKMPCLEQSGRRISRRSLLKLGSVVAQDESGSCAAS